MIPEVSTTVLAVVELFDVEMLCHYHVKRKLFKRINDDESIEYEMDSMQSAMKHGMSTFCLNLVQNNKTL